MSKRAAYEGGAWAVGGVLNRHALTPLQERHADLLAKWFSAQGKARAGDPQYARMVPILARELEALEKQIAAERDTPTGGENPHSDKQRRAENGTASGV